MIPRWTWRTDNPADIRGLHALRLPEARMIMSTAQQIITPGDFRFLNELQRELEACAIALRERQAKAPLPGPPWDNAAGLS